MIDAYKTEQEIKNNLIDFILDWKKIKRPEIRDTLRDIWGSHNPSEGSLLSDLLIENNFSYESNDPPATLETLDPSYFGNLIDQFNFKNKVIQTKEFPRLHNDLRYFGGNHTLQESFLDVLQDNKFSPSTPLFAHQEKAIRSAIEGKDFILSSGTGSGKTESFLLPSLAKLFNETDEERKLPGIRVLIIYPMNALINSQINRIQSLIGVQDPTREPVRFALYNSKLRDSLKRSYVYRNETDDYCHWPDVQIMSREELRQNPPHILVTNYSMLEYSLIRPKDFVLFHPDRQKLHTIILDEAHTYIGAMAAEIAMLIRRVLLAFNKTSSDVQFFATSATLGDPSKDEGLQLRTFASDLFSKDINNIIYIDGKRAKPLSFDNSANPIATEEVVRLAEKFKQLGYRATNQDYMEIVTAMFPEITTESLPSAVYQVISRNKMLVDLVNDLIVAPITITELAKKVGLVDNNSLAYGIISLLSMAAEDQKGTNTVKLRLHSVVRAPSGIYYCQNCKTYKSSYHPYCINEGCKDQPMWELVACKQCGEVYLCVQKNFEGKYQQINWSGKGNAILQVTTMDGKTVKECEQCTIDLSDDEQGEKPEDFDNYVIDPESALYKQAFFAPMSVSIDLVQKIAIDSLYANLEPHEKSNEKWLPGEGRRLLTFTDNRQRAAKLPSALDWLHEIYLGNRLIYESVLDAFEKKRSVTEGDNFALLSERGKVWADIGITDKPLVVQKLNSIETWTAESLTCIINSMCSENAELFWFPPNYSKSDFVQDLLASRHDRSCLLTFAEASKALSLHKDLREMIGIFEKIEPVEQWENKDTRKSIASWIMVRSLGIRSSSQYLPENSGLFALDFPIDDSFVDALKNFSVFDRYTREQLTVLTKSLLHHMRANGAIDVEIHKDDSLEEAQKFTLQNALINKYMVLERSNIPDGATSYIKSWYNLKTNTATAPIMILSKALSDDTISVETGREIIATLWDCLKAKAPSLLVKHKKIEDAYALSLKKTTLLVNPPLYRCDTCNRTSPHHINGTCIVPSCQGSVYLLDRPVIEDMYGYKRSTTFPKLGMRTFEHTAQLELSELSKNEKLFTNGEINVLSSSTTMELGIDIGGITSIVLTNCPPGPSNYLQRAGRAGRRSDRISYVLTSARKVPLDLYFFYTPKLFFTRKPHDPYVSLNSDKIVRRHLNAYILREFFNHFAKNADQSSVSHSSASNPLAVYGIVRDFFGIEPEGKYSKFMINYLLDWLNSTKNLPLLKELLLGTNFGLTFNLQSYFIELSDQFLEIYGTLTSYVRDLTAAINDETGNNNRKRALGYFKSSLLGTDLVTFLINQSILPKYGFPVDVVKLNTVNHATKIKNEENNPEKGPLYQMQRGAEVAISEYAPGAQLIAGKHLLISSGISLDNQFGGESFSGNSQIDRKRFIVCKSCSHFFIVPPAVRDIECPVCGKHTYTVPPISDNGALGGNDNQIEEAILPKGFRVDYNEKQPYAPNKIDKHTLFRSIHASLETDESKFVPVIPDILSIASTPSATFYSINHGPQRQGYKVCLKCGRSYHQGESKKMKNHKRLYSDKPCKSQQYLEYQRLMAKFVTDAIQIRFKANALPLQRSVAEQLIFIETFARCLQLASAKFLGIDERELKFLTQHYKDKDTETWGNVEIVLYDNVPGGAGYAEMIMGLFRYPKFYETLIEITDCPESCDSACPACLIAYEKDDPIGNPYNRHLVRDFLQSKEISVFFNNYIGSTIPTRDDKIIYSIVKDVSMLLQNSTNGKTTLYFDRLPEDKFSVRGQFGTLMELANTGSDISIVFAPLIEIKDNLWVQQNLLYGSTYTDNKIQLRKGEPKQGLNFACVVETDTETCIYEYFPSASTALTPFSEFPCMRRKATADFIYPIHQEILEIEEKTKTIQSFRIKPKANINYQNTKLWSHLCSEFGIDPKKSIASIWYTDRYFSRYAENLCFLLLLQDMTLQQHADIQIAVGARVESYSDLVFYNRELQQTTLRKQLEKIGRSNIHLRLYVNTELSKPIDPGQMHDRLMQIRFSDDSQVLLTFDGGMVFFSPYIDRNWEVNEEEFSSMIRRMELRYNKFGQFRESLIFCDHAPDNLIPSRFEEALKFGRIKLV